MTQASGPRAAIIGAGLMGRWHADAIRRLGGRVTLIVDPDDTAREALGRRHPEARLVRTLDPEDVRRHAAAAHVCTPAATHRVLITSLLDTRVPVLAEKPLAEDANTTASLVALAERAGVVLCPVHQFVFQDGVRQLARWRPDLGAIRRIEFSAVSAGAAGSDAASLDALIAEILPHPLALLAALFETPVATIDWQVIHPTPGEFRAVATSAGAIVDVAISAHGRPTENTLRVVADLGSVRADLFHGYAVRHAATVSRRAKVAHPFVISAKNLHSASLNLLRRAVRREPAYPGLRSLVDAFYDAVNRGAPSPISPAQIVDVAVARDRLLEGMRSIG